MSRRTYSRERRRAELTRRVNLEPIEGRKSVGDLSSPLVMAYQALAGAGLSMLIQPQTAPARPSSRPTARDGVRAAEPPHPAGKRREEAEAPGGSGGEPYVSRAVDMPSGSAPMPTSAGRIRPMALPARPPGSGTGNPAASALWAQPQITGPAGSGPPSQPPGGVRGPAGLQGLKSVDGGGIQGVADTDGDLEPAGDGPILFAGSGTGTGTGTGTGSGSGCKPTVWVTAEDDSASEVPDTDWAKFRFHRSGCTATANILVPFTVTGTARAGLDYKFVYGVTQYDYLSNVIIPANPGYVDVFVKPLDDQVAEDRETVDVTLSDGGYYLGNRWAEAKINDDEPRVFVVAVDKDASEPGTDTGTFRIYRADGSPVSDARAVGVWYALFGSATPNADYFDTPHYAVIPANDYAVDVTITPKDDNEREPDEEVTLVLAPMQVGVSPYLTKPRIRDSVTIHDDEPTVTLTALDADAAEPSNPGQFRISRTGSTSQALDVFFGVFGTATPGADYAPISGYAQIPTGSSSTTVNVATYDDSVYEGRESVIAVLARDAGWYHVGTPNVAQVDIRDDETPPPQVPPPEDETSDGPDEAGTGEEAARVGGSLSADALGGQVQYDPDACGCGDGGRDYRPVYVGAGDARPIETVGTDLPAGSPVPSRIDATLAIGSLTGPTTVYATTGLSAGQPIHMTSRFDAHTLATGYYQYTATVVSHYSSGNSTATSSGWMAIVNLASSAVGAGWAYRGLGRLYTFSGGVLYLRSDGSASAYRALSGGGYQTPAGSFDTLTQVSGGYNLVTPQRTTYTFDSAGLLRSIIDRNLFTTTFTYTDADSDGKYQELQTVIDPFGRRTTYTYSGGLLSSILDYAGRVTTYTHTGSLLTGVVEPDPDGPGGPLASPETQISYDSSDRLKAVRDENLNRTTVTYDGAGRLQRLDYADGGYVTLQSIQSSRLPAAGSGTAGNPAPLAQLMGETAVITEAVDSSTTRVTTVTTDRYGYPTEILDPTGGLTAYIRDANGQVLVEADPRPDVAGGDVPPLTTFTYDPRGNLTGRTSVDGTQEIWTYDSNFNQVTSYRIKNGSFDRRTTYTLESGYGNVATEVDPDGKTTTYTYGNLSTNANRVLLAVTRPDPDGAGIGVPAPTTTLVYDSYGRVGTIIAPDGSYTLRAAYDSADRLVAATDALGRVTSYAYDALDRLTTLTRPDPAGGSSYVRTTYAYDAKGHLTSTTDPLGRRTTYAYDARGRLTGATALKPDGSQAAPPVTYAYDLAGRMVRSTDPMGRVTTYAYDLMDRLTTITYPDPDGAGGNLPSPWWGATYDRLGRVTSVSDPQTTVTYRYSLQSRTVAAWDAEGHATTSVYDPAGNLVTVHDPAGRSIVYAYDALDRLTSVRRPDPAGGSSYAWTTFTYDPLGRQTAAIDPLGRRTTFSYDVLDRLAAVTTADPATSGTLRTTYTYDAVGNLTGVIDPLGRLTSYAYDALDRLTVVRQPDPAGGSSYVRTTYAYDAVGNLTRVTDPLGRVSSFAYDALDRLTVITRPDPGTGAHGPTSVTFTYDDAGNPTSVTDPLNRRVTYVYDALDRLTAVVTADPASSGTLRTTYAYDAQGQLAAVTDPLLHATTYAYDELGRLESVTDPLLRVTHYGYDEVDRLISVSRPLDSLVSYAYDALDRLVAVSTADPNSSTPLATTFVYDLAGNQTGAIDPLGRRVTYAYDALDRLTAVVTADPASSGTLRTTYAYDAVGNLTSVVDPLLHRTTYVYDALDRLQVTIDPLTKRTTYAYDAASNLTRVTDPNSNVTTLVYDGLDRLVAEVDPRGKTASYTYDAADQLTRTVDRLGRAVTYGYDALGRQTSERWLDGAGATVRLTTYGYDAVGNLTSAQDPDSVLGFEYDAADQLIAAASAGTAGQPSLALTYGVDALGRRSWVSDDLQDQAVTTYAYDSAGRLTTLTRSVDDVVGALVTLSYDRAGRRTALTRSVDGTGTAVRTSYAYDVLDRLTTLTHQVVGGSALATYAYGYDAADRPVSESNAEGSVTYVYDAADQLTTVTGARAESFGYDAAGNRNTSGYTNAAANHQTASPGYSYTYDDEGNLASKTETSTGAVTTYAYDYRDRMVGATVRNSSGTVIGQATYTYDALDRRIGVSADVDGAGAGAPAVTWTAYDGSEPYADFDGTGTLRARYLHGPAVDELLGRTDGAGTTSWYLTDRLGTVRDIASTAGSVIDHVAYDSYGKVTYESSPANGDRFKFTGRELDAVTGLQSHRARYYDPTTGRWTQRDPIGFAAGDANLYRYVGNAPTDAVDPSGLDKMVAGPGGAAASPGGQDSSLGEDLLRRAGEIAVEALKSRLAGAVADFANRYADGRHFNWAEDDLINHFLLRYGPAGLALLDAAARNGTRIEVDYDTDRWWWDGNASRDIYQNRIVVYKERTDSKFVSLSEAAQALHDELSRAFGPSMLSPLFQALSLSNAQLAYVLAHPEDFNEAIAQAAREARCDEQAAVNFMANGAQKILEDRARDEAIGASAASVGAALLFFLRYSKNLRRAAKALGRSDDNIRDSLRGGKRGGQAAFSRSAEDVVSNHIGVPRNTLGDAGDTIPGTGRGGVRYPDYPVHGTHGTLRQRGSIVEVKASRKANPRSGLSARDRAQVRDSIEYARELRRRAANEPDLDLRAQMEKAKVELFTDYPRPTKGKFKEYVDEGILEWKPIPSQ